MPKIKIVTDSAGDIPAELRKKYNIDVLCFPITVGDKSFRDGDIPPGEYYDLIDKCPELPVHSQITIFDFESLYEKYAEEGVEELFYVSINSHGSATYQNACLARENFLEARPGAAEKINIRVIDSGTYSATYGYPVTEAAKMAENGASADEIEKYLRDWFEVCEVYLAAYTLRYVKKSGRVSAAAAFAGELMGLKPIILLKKESTKVTSKARGEQNVVPKLAEVVCTRIEKDSPYMVIQGREPRFAEELAELLKNKLGYPPVDITFKVGGAIAANSGPDIVAAAFKAKK